MKGGEIMENQEVLNLVLAKLEKMEAKFDKMESRMDNMEAKMDKMETKIDKIEAKVNSLEVTVMEIQEDTKVTRSAVNALIEWAENVSVITNVSFPIKKAK